MSKGQSRGISFIAAAVVLTAASFAACSNWEGVTLDQRESNLTSPNGAITQGADEARSNWYNDQPGLDPSIVGGPNFKRLFNTTLTLSAGEKILAQPLVWNNKVLVATEANNLYLLDAVTGAITNSRALGGAFNASGIGCGDITPTVGITGTPVIDTSSNTAYVVSKMANGDHQMHAVDAGTLAEKAGFPVTISGVTAQNDTSKVFNSQYQHQRPGLLLMGGVVYAAFASHCDIGDYRGWVVGVSTAGAIKARFTTEANSTGKASGIWMSGAGLMSDGAGQILYATGNGMGNPALPGPVASNAPPGYTEEAVVRTVVQADGSLKSTDWFAPFNAHNMGDDDLAGGGITSLPSQFGTAAFPRTAVIVGKAGLFYLLNRDKLGGYQNGAGAGDDVLATVNLSGATWGHPAVWPGDGGYVFVTTNGGTGGLGYRLQVLKYGVNGTKPTMSLVGTAQTAGVTDNFGSYSGSPVVTSNGTTAGSAVVWCVGNTAQLRVYKLNGSNLTRIFADSTGSTAKFQTVGVGSGRVYVGTGDGHVLGYGAGTSALTAPALSFGNVTVGGAGSTQNATFTANQTLTISAASSFTSTNGVFTFNTTGLTFPKNMTSGQTFTLPVTFKPTAAGSVSGAINVAISGGGGGSVSLTGVGIVNAAQLNVTPVSLNFGGVVTGQTKQLTVTIQNTGTQTLNFNAPTLPAAPYSATGVPAAGATLAAGASVIATVTFAPTAGGTSNGNLVINTSNGGNATIPLTGQSGTAPHMVVTPLALDFGTIAAGSTKSMSFTIQNTGGTDMTMTISKYPTGAFINTTTLGEGATVLAGQTVTETVRFQPTAAGTFTSAWELTANDGQPRVAVNLSGVATGAPAALPRTGWIGTSSTASGDVPGNALDGNTGTRWSTGAVQAAGMWFQVDMGSAQTVSQIQMDSANGDYARAFSVYVTNDTANLGTAVATGTAAATPVNVSFTAKSGRFIRVVLGTIPAGTTAWWSIQEFNAYGSGGGGTGAAGSGGGGTGAAGSGGGGTGAAGAGGSGGGSVMINAGGPAVSPYVADVSFTGGTTIVHANTIDLTGVTNPAPATVYQSARVGNFSYTIGGFAANSSHTVRLHMCETYFNTTGSRTFNVSINGTQVLTAYDVRAAAGAINKAIVPQFTATANASGQYVIQFTTVVNNSLVSGIQIQ